MSRGKKIAAGGFVSLLILVLAAAWFLGFFSSEPEEASVDASLAAIAAEAEAEEDAEGEEDPENDDADASVDEVQPESVNDLTGTWTIETGDATFVGYRVDEVLSGVDFTAVGRTPTVSGTLVADGTTITSVDILADLRDLESDNGARDRQIRGQALESDTFPDGIFTLTSPIELGSIPPAGETVTVTATGDLTIHGVTRSVDVELEGATQDTRLVIVGSLPVSLSDYDIATPEAPIVASVEDAAIVEFSLVLSR